LFFEIDPVLQALLAGTLTWLLTAFGASLVIFTSRVSQAYLDASLGVAAGVMIAASFWSLLHPSVQMAVEAGYTAKWLPASIGFLAGAGFLRVSDRLLPHVHLDLGKSEGLETSWRRSTLLVLAITLHHIPEGLAVGVAFGAAAVAPLIVDQQAQAASAMALAIGIALHNFPEGTAVALPLRREGMSKGRALWWAQATGIVDPLAGMTGAALVLLVVPILPYALAFAAGAMMYVVVEELIPESQRNGHVDLATIGLIFGFTLMMILDVGLV